jgi:putative SOS response-associated peptidase YedK
MCSRYSISATSDQLSSRFQVDVPPAYYKPNYNAAPSQLLPVITSDSPQGVSLFYWGLPPERAQNKSISERIINLRIETLQEKAIYKRTMKTHRCLIPADGYYTWKQLGKKTTVPYRIIRKDKALFAFAGIWEEYESEAGDSLHTFSIITVPANNVLAGISERMPVILNLDEERIWLNVQAIETELLSVLKSYPEDSLEFYTVSPRINSIQNNDSTLTRPAPAADQHGNLTLFN